MERDARFVERRPRIRGGRASLARCGHAVYAANPYSEISGAAISEVTVRTFGPHWIVPLCAAGRLRVVVSLSSQAVELEAEARSPTAVLSWGRADVRSSEVPAGVPAALYSPEGAALQAYEATGRRIAGIPELIMNPMPGAPALVRWRIAFETPVQVRGARSGVARSRKLLLVGFGDTFRTSGLLDENPQGEGPLRSWTDAVTRKPFTVVLRADATHAVELVTPLP
jgi:hypothetical protein